jgi:hypothetical protein
VGKIYVADNRKALGTRHNDKLGDIPAHGRFADHKLGVNGICVRIDRLDTVVDDS